MFKKLISFVLALVLVSGLASFALAEHYYDLTQDPDAYPYAPQYEYLRVVNCDEWVSVWSDTEKTSRTGILPKGSIIRYWQPYSDEFIYFDMVGDGGFVSWDYLAAKDGSLDLGKPLRVVNCKEWISVWSAPTNTSTRLATLPLGTRIDYWEPHDRDFITCNVNGRVGYVSWNYLSVIG